MSLQPSEIHDSARILVVEDDPTARALLAMLLSAWGYHATTAETVKEGLELLRTAAFELVLSDVSMPDQDGFAFVAQLREMGFADIPVILMSATHDSARRVAGLNIGADDFVSKPINSEELFARVQAHLRRAARYRQLAEDSNLEPLTRTLNRRGLADMFARECARLRRLGEPISAIVLDINDFKRINDAYGHAAGDRALQAVSQDIEKAFARPTDSPALEATSS